MLWKFLGIFSVAEEVLGDISSQLGRYETWSSRGASVPLPDLQGSRGKNMRSEIGN